MALFWIIITLMLLVALALLLAPLFFTHKRDLSTFALILALVVLLPIISMSLYRHWGYSKQLQQTLQIKAELRQLKNPQQVIILLQKHLKQIPDSARGWYLLGKIYFDVGKYVQAVQALAKAYQLQPNNVNIMVQYVEALFIVNRQHLNNQALKIVDKVLKQQPNHFNMINLLAINAYRMGNYKKAIAYWEDLLRTVPKQSREAKLIRRMLKKAQEPQK